MVAAVAEVGECEVLLVGEALEDVVEVWEGEAGVVGRLSMTAVERK